jgi:hypothetical protein
VILLYMKKILTISTVLLLVSVSAGIFLRYFFSGRDAECFPELEEGIYMGSFSGKGPREIIPQNSSFIVSLATPGFYMFSFLSDGFTPVLVPVGRDGKNRERGNSIPCIEPLLIDESSLCRMSGTLTESGLKGVVRCRDGVSDSFTAELQSQVSLSSMLDRDAPRYSEPAHRKILADFSRKEFAASSIRELKMKKSALLSEQEKMEEAWSSPDELEKGIQELEDEISLIKTGIKSLENKKEKLNTQRNQLFRVSQKGVEVELERRLSRTEADVMSRTTKPYVDKGQMDVFSGRDSDSDTRSEEEKKLYEDDVSPEGRTDDTSGSPDDSGAWWKTLR